MNWLAMMIARHGAWSMFRLNPISGVDWAMVVRGESLAMSQKLEAACIQATFDEANLGRWTALANFRKAVSDVR